MMVRQIEKLLDLATAERVCAALVAAGFMHDFVQETAALYLAGASIGPLESNLLTSDDAARLRSAIKDGPKD